MASFSIYQVVSPKGSSLLVSAVVKLLEKVYLSGSRAIFFSPIQERVELVDKSLWTYSTNAFIPHGDKRLGFAESQLIYFTNAFENPNNATVLVMMDTFDLANPSYADFEKVMVMFEDTTIVPEMERTYRDLKDAGKNVNYWKQSSKGWEKLS